MGKTEAATLTAAAIQDAATVASNGAANAHANGSGSLQAGDATELSNLMARLDSRTATIGILGMGYVGLPLIMAFAGAGFPTIGFDTKQATIDNLQQGESHIGDIPASAIATAIAAEKFTATTDFSRLQECDVAIICVPTPMTAMRDPDLRAVQSATHAVRQTLHAGQLVVLESTTYPGTTEEVVLPALEATGLKAGQDFFLAFSPERIDPGNVDFPVHKVPKVVGGHTPSCLEAALKLYGAVVDKTVPVSSTQAAELTKLLENIFRSVNIALVNEMAMLCDRMGMDIWEVVEAAGTKPYGFKKFLPGPGLGGHCIPIDPFYLSWKARQYDFQTNFIELAGEVNSAMPRFVVNKIIRSLNDDSKAARGSRIALLGMSYKANVGDCRESPSLRIAELLLELGAQIHYNDPHVDSVNIKGHTLLSEPLDDILNADCVVMLTDHSAYDYAAIANQATLIVDTRNAFKAVKAPAARLVKL